jgi:psp operon transcriptional activator
VYRADSERVTEIVFDPFSDPFSHRHTVGTPLSAIAPYTDAVAADDDVSLAATSFHEIVRDFEIKVIKQALQDTRHHQRKAAQHLGLTYHQFRNLYRKYRDLLVQD